MSYEGSMLATLEMPTRQNVELALLKALFRHEGSIEEFGAGEHIVEEMANEFNLSNNQRTAVLETIYRKENRLKKSPLWHRLLFRAADSLARQNLITRPTDTLKITGKREWMLTESGFDQSLRLLAISPETKEILPTKSFEVQKVAKQLIETARPEKYDPVDESKSIVKKLKESTIRARGFRQAVLQAYDHSCAFCGLKLRAPIYNLWEAEAAHIVPHSALGRDDVWNGITLCRTHHWAFDVGWLSLQDNFIIQVSPIIDSLGLFVETFQVSNSIKNYSKNNVQMRLPLNSNLYPHQAALAWHRKHIFCVNI